MMDVPQRYADLDRISGVLEESALTPQPVPEDTASLLHSMSYRFGPIGWSYEIGGSPAPTSSLPDSSPDSWAADQPDPAWNVPKHLPICGFGIFNPMGPTVSSLEVSLQDGATGLQFALFHVMRHPHSPAVTLLGTVDDASDLGALIRESLAARSPDSVLGGGPEWVEIWAHEQDVIAGMTAFAESDEESDLGHEANRLVQFALTPWARVSGDAVDDDAELDPELDPVEAWLAAITDYVVVTGERLFMRSAWEGALNYRKSQWDPSAAQSAADAARNRAQERLQAEVSSSP
jgi:hypothetical protein